MSSDINESTDLVVQEESSLEESELLLDWAALSEGLLDQYADWLPFLAFGIPYVQIAKIFGVDKSTITKALNRNENLGRAVARARKMVKRQLHYVWLDQKAVLAWKNLDYYLNLDPMEKDENGRYVHDSSTRHVLLSEKAKMTRFILNQLGLHVQRHEVEYNVPKPMFMGDNSLAVLVVDRVTRALEQPDGDIVVGEYKYLHDGVSEPFKPTEEEVKVRSSYDRMSPKGDYFGEKKTD